PGESVDDKADAIIAAIEKIGGSASLDSSNSTAGTQVNVAGKIKLVKSTSGETDKIISLGPVDPGSFVASAFCGDLTGTTPGGGATAAYSAIFGFDGVLAQSRLLYDDLSAKSIDGLLTDTYANLLSGLPASLQGSLSLDLTSDMIRFDLPEY